MSASKIIPVCFLVLIASYKFIASGQDRALNQAPIQQYQVSDQPQLLPEAGDRTFETGEKQRHPNAALNTYVQHNQPVSNANSQLHQAYDVAVQYWKGYGIQPPAQFVVSQNLLNGYGCLSLRNRNASGFYCGNNGGTVSVKPTGDFDIDAYVIAHEVAHNALDKMNVLQGNSLMPLNEIAADCLAGVTFSETGIGNPQSVINRLEMVEATDVHAEGPTRAAWFIAGYEQGQSVCFEVGK